jgi:hypothetical protein
MALIIEREDNSLRKRSIIPRDRDDAINRLRDNRIRSLLSPAADLLATCIGKRSPGATGGRSD